MINLKTTSKGIGFIEVMTATVIISIACIGLMMGVVITYLKLLEVLVINKL